MMLLAAFADYLLKVGDYLGPLNQSHLPPWTYAPTPQGGRKKL
jgi:hypothetical protein